MSSRRKCLWKVQIAPKGFFARLAPSLARFPCPTWFSFEAKTFRVSPGQRAGQGLTSKGDYMTKKPETHAKRLSKRDLGMFFTLVFLGLLAACSPTAKNIIYTLTPPPGTETAPAGLNVTPDVQKFLADHKVPYTTGVDGSATIDLADTSTTEKRAVEKISVTQTNDGLAKEILTGYNKEDGSRVVFVENYGWVKDIDIASSTPENPLKVPFEWTQDTGVLNTLVALHYSESPTIAPDAVNPHYYININWYGSFAPYLSFDYINCNSNDPEATFTKAQKPFTWSGFFKTTASQGKEIVILVQTRKNPTEINKKQLINLFFGLDGETFQQMIEKKVKDGRSLIRLYIDDDYVQLSGVIPPPKEFPWNSTTLSFARQRENPTVLGLQKQGELFSLLEEEDIIKAKITALQNKESGSSNLDYFVRIQSIPSKMALKILLPAFEGWPQGQLK